jgi:hypothetical protein
MELQRSYNLPNCTLVLDGLSDMAGDNPSRLSILMSATCNLLGQAQPLSGDRSFLEALSQTVSRYAQTCLSGVGRSLKNNPSDRIQLSPLGPGRHQLKVWGDEASEPSSFTLTTVQLFDLVEAIDQFLADNLSLPDMSLGLAPVSRRLVSASEPLAKRVAAPAIGISGLAIATAALMTMPTPQIKRPEVTSPAATTKVDPAKPATAPSGAPSGTPTTAASPSAESLDQATPISDPGQIEAIQATLTDKIEAAWTAPPQFQQPLTYRVSASADGNILGYRGTDATTQQYTGPEPLRELVFLPPSGVTTEAIAQYEVILTPDGKLSIKPWASAGTSPTSSPAPSSSPTASPEAAASPTASPATTATLQDPAQLETLTTNLYDQIDKTWKTEPSFQGPIAYRVTLDSQGTIVKVEPQDSEAINFAVETPLESLKESTTPNGGTADFKVIFQPSGALEVSPWDGF